MAQHKTNAGACELKRNLQIALFAAVLSCTTAGYAIGQEHAPASAPAAAQEHAPAQAPAGEHAQPAGEHEAEGGHDQSIGGMILSMGWPVANFIIFLGVLYYYLNKPFTEYLASRSSSIRKDLVEAAELRSTATSQLAAIEQKLQALPGEVSALRARGAEEIKAEEQRISAAAAADRERLLEQTRREIDLQVRLAKKEILEHAADLSVQLATDRVKKEMTPADQDRIVDRYLTMVKETK